MNASFPLYTIGDFVGQPGRATEFAITRFADIDEADLAHIEDPHKHTFYEIIWVEAGVSRQTIDYQTYDIAPGTLFFISPGQLHRFEEWQPVTGGSLFFTDAFFLLNQQNRDRLFELSFLDNFYGKPYLQPSAADYAQIVHTIDLLFQEWNRPDHAVGITQSLLHVLLGQIQRCADAEEPRPDRRSVFIYKQLHGLLEQHFRESLTARDYADQLAITAHHLNHIAKQVTGKTTSALIRDRTMLEAKRLLTFTDQPIADIAAQLGYFDSSYFAKLFRAETGQSPVGFKAAASTGRVSENYRKR